MLGPLTAANAAIAVLGTLQLPNLLISCATQLVT